MTHSRIFSTVCMLIIPTFMYPVLTCPFCYRVISNCLVQLFHSSTLMSKAVSDLTHPKSTSWFPLPHPPTPFLFKGNSIPQFLKPKALEWPLTSLFSTQQPPWFCCKSKHVLSFTKTFQYYLLKAKFILMTYIVSLLDNWPFFTCFSLTPFEPHQPPCLPLNIPGCFHFTLYLTFPSQNSVISSPSPWKFT